MKMSSTALALLATAWAASSFAAGARAQCNAWSSEFSVSGLGAGTATAQIAYDDGSGPALFVGGSFATIAGITANGIAKWNGSSWTTFGCGLASGGAGWGVRAFAVFDDGSGPALYAGGSFIGIGGVAASNLAKWDGAAWSPVGGGTDGAVNALCVFDDGSGPKLFAGGHFTTAGGVAATRLARWNGSAWSSVMSFTNYDFSHPTPYVSALAVHDDGSGPALFVGGSFGFAGGVYCANVGRWNGTSMFGFPHGVELPVLAFATYDDGSGPDLYVAGEFQYILATAQTYGIARWDGAQLTPVTSTGSATSPGLVPIHSLQVFDDGSGPKLFAGGKRPVTTGAALRVWSSGPAWSNYGNVVSGYYAPVLATVNSLAVFDKGSGARLFVGGTFDDAGGIYVNGFTSGRGSSWTSYGTNHAVDRAVRAFTLHDDGTGPQLYAAGDFGHAGSVVAPRVARYDGSTWSSLGVGPLLSVLSLASFNGELYVGGKFDSIPGVAGTNHIARWNGSSWASVGGGIPGNSIDQRVNAMLVHDDGTGPALFVAGGFMQAGGVNARRIAKWNGSVWSTLGGGALDNEAFALAEFDSGSGSELYVGGTFGYPSGYLARWTPAGWQNVGPAPNDWVRAFAVFDDGTGSALYAGGKFTQIGGMPASRVARWNGSSWSALGSGVDGEVFAMAVFDDGSGEALYVAGAQITSAGGVPTQRIARWNGTQWSALGSGINAGQIYALTVHDDALFAGGDFFDAGGNVSPNVASWLRACTCPPLAYCTAGTSSNGCVPSIGGVGTPSASGAGSFVVTASGVEGQKLGLLFYGISGATSAPWGTTTSTLCVKPPQQRTGQSSSGGTSGLCDGAFTLDFNAYLATHPTALGQPFSAGDAVGMQGWYRDPPNPKTTSLTDALEFYLCP